MNSVLNFSNARSLGAVEKSCRPRTSEYRPGCAVHNFGRIVCLPLGKQEPRRSEFIRESGVSDADVYQVHRLRE
jgi:hypothetical protein